MKPWIISLRLRTLPLAISVIAMGSVLAFRSGSFDWNIFFLACITTILLQILSNLANEYGDFEKGTDNKSRSGPIRSIQSGLISKNAMLRAVLICAILSLLSGLILLYFASDSMEMFITFLGLGILAIIGAIYYTTGKHAYGYRGLGDISVFLFFGLLGVLGSYYLYQKSISPEILLPATSMGLFSTAVLNVNNIRDIENDRNSGKITIPVRLGLNKAIHYHWILLLAAVMTSLVYTALTYSHPLQLVYLIIVPLLIRNVIGVRKFAGQSSLDPFLKQMVLTTLLYVFTFTLGIILGS
ncbi:MAG: 1,4-dihydroxy-2-naphthoate polyprenyltransferase [Bacteroidia bacterium]|nr:1,4-dihydroxy-2-naphthoate polyprenyltransferase [Bacteroidia bacterium]